MYGEWLRVTPADLERAKGDLAWLQDRAEEISETEYDDGRDVARCRSFSTDKTWHALDYLLDRHGFPVSIVFGEEAFVDDPEDPAADWGYGPPRYLTPERVQAAATALAPLTGEDLIAGVDQADLHRDGVYPSIWDRPDELPWAVCHVPDVKVYFEAAAKAGDAVVCWIS
jgi:hypothetical protein